MSTDCQSLPVSTCETLPVLTVAMRRRRRQPRHPVGFYVVCVVVFCERWAGYMLASSVVLLLGQRYGYARADALRLAGLFNAASYLGILPGGLIADRGLGSYRALHLSTLLLALGYATLMLSGNRALWLALGFLVLGHALFKPSTQAVIARLYPLADSRLDAAQIVLCLAVNAGATLGALLMGLFVRDTRWGRAFALAAAVMLVGRLVLAVGRAALLRRPLVPDAARPDLLTSDTVPTWSGVKMIAALTLAMLIYTVCCGQVEGSLLLLAQDRTDRVLLGFAVPAAWFVGLPALLVLVLAPVQLALLARIGRRLNPQRLIAWGLLATALAFVAVIPAALPDSAQRVSMGWLVACLTLLVVGELLVAPLGLSELLRRVPPRWVGVAVGVWYLAGALGYWLAGEIGALWVRWSPLAAVAVLFTLPLGGAWVLWRAGLDGMGSRSMRRG